MANNKPREKDWREEIKFAVRNQRDSAYCYCHACVTCIEAMHFLNKGQRVQLSDQQAIDGFKMPNDPKEKIKPKHILAYFEENKWITTSQNYPSNIVNNKYVKGKFDKRKFRAPKIGVARWEYIEAGRDGDKEKAMMDAVDKRPILGFLSYDRTSKDFTNYENRWDIFCEHTEGDLSHAVVIVGYGREDERDYWIILNSWGTRWVGIGIMLSFAWPILKS